MALEKAFAQACQQILREDDLKLPEYIQQSLTKEPFSAEFIKGDSLYLKIYGREHFLLSKIVPLLQHIGLAIHSEISYEIPQKERPIYVSRYKIANESIEAVIHAKANILALLKQMLCTPTLPSTSLLRLTLLENLSPRELELLDALIGYANQLIPSFNRTMIGDTLIKHHTITRALVDYFQMKFTPNLKRRKSLLNEQANRIEELLRPITHITEDRVLRILYDILRQMVRTNYFLQKEAIALKIHTFKIERKTKTLEPRIEAYVRHHALQGVHLRMTSVSRGGIRWSDRTEDFRSEVHSLMRTQEGKNAVIVPSGAKGGFIIHHPKEAIDKERFTQYYSLYIDSLLDLVDNKIDDQVITDPNIVRYDGDDDYFVVAADKGTARMSDTANAIALRHGFWLGDAFASGGSHGYNHKELGITAQGALKSVERYFIEKGENFYETPITVIGIGSMSGDVFGNGMLLSRYFKLIAAISHSDIFIDPDPDPLSAYKTRQQLFKEAKGWRHYPQEKISQGGGVFSREAKEIPLSPEIQKLFRTTKSTMSGEEMARNVLKLKADLLFNGGVGTYIKASWQSNLDVGDKANENVRIDADELHVKAVCEGGNLGFTPPARIQFSKRGGFINLDAIDNSAGVHTSDYEVNLKIVLNQLTQKGQLDDKSRIDALMHQADMVVNRVLWTNYHQSLAISLDRLRSIEEQTPFLKTITLLEERLDVFNRDLFFIPKNEAIETILDQEGALVRPILGILLLYSKLFVKQQLLESNLLDDPFTEEYLLKYFPKTFSTLYEDEILKHPLRRGIAATVIANRIINSAGSTFISDFESLGQERFIAKIKSYLICTQLFGANDIRYEIFRHDYQMGASDQYALLFEVERTLLFSVEWMLRHLSTDQIHAPTLLRYKSEIAKLFEEVVVSAQTKQSSTLTRYFHHLPFMKFTVAAIILHERNHRRFDEMAKLMYAVVETLHINKILETLDRFQAQSDQEHRIKRQLAEFVEFSVTTLCEKVIHYQRKGESTKDALQSYLRDCDTRYTRFEEDYNAFLNSEEKPIEEIALLVNTLMQMTLENLI